MRTYRLDRREPAPFDEPLDEVENKRCRAMGARARAAGLGVESSPYRPWTRYDVAWRRGWWGLRWKQRVPGQNGLVEE